MGAPAGARAEISPGGHRMAKLLPTGELVEDQSTGRLALFDMAFRPFFLLGAILSVVSLSLWASTLSGHLELVVYGGTLWWHAHEMLFGFVVAIVVGFLLTAVKTWTGQPAFHGASLTGLVLLWLCGRLFLMLPDTLPQWLIAATDLAFLPVAAVILARPVVRVKQWRNIIFVPLLLAMTAANTIMHWAAYHNDPVIQHQAATTMVLLITLLMTIMAGRVVPMFTANGTSTKKVEPKAWLEKTALVSMLLAIVASLDLPAAPPVAASLCFIFAAVVHSVRAARWRIWVTFKTPLVWSLHLSYWCIPLGLLLYGLRGLLPAVSSSQAIHALTVGAMGMMILAMISRVSLGHTGRPIVVGKVMTVAFALFFVGFIVRVFGIYWYSNYTSLIVTAAVLWTVGYGCFIALYLPMLVRPRVDGKPG